MSHLKQENEHMWRAVYMIKLTWVIHSVWHEEDCIMVLAKAVCIFLCFNQCPICHLNKTRKMPWWTAVLQVEVTLIVIWVWSDKECAMVLERAVCASLFLYTSRRSCWTIPAQATPIPAKIKTYSSTGFVTIFIFLQEIHRNSRIRTSQPYYNASITITLMCQSVPAQGMRVETWKTTSQVELA